MGDGSQIRVGVDEFIGGENGFKILSALIRTFHSKGYFTLDHFRLVRRAIDYWLGTHFFPLHENLSAKWNGYIQLLNHGGIRIRPVSEKLLWKWNKEGGDITASTAYHIIFERSRGSLYTRWAHKMWRWQAPLKIKCFFWILTHNRILT